MAPDRGIEISATLRKELLNALHMGRIEPGDRLRSIRSVARARKVDHRVVAEAYHSLANEGLVEIRGRSGVYASAPAPPPAPPQTRDRWLATVLSEGWTRDLTSNRLADLVRCCTTAGELRCICVESNLDQMTAYRDELEEVAGLHPAPLYVQSGDRTGIAEPGERNRICAEIREADVVVTTEYHLAAVHGIAREHHIPLIVIRIHPELGSAVRSHLRQRRLTVVSATKEFGARLRLMYEDVLHRSDRLRVVLAGDAAIRRKLDPEEPVLLTRAARDLLPPGLNPRRLVFPHSPTIAP
ncbi:MAG TPA: GntR family transcriptional regulator, partial [Longimicrobiaceae bacterium]|nr:GntR family transcriptional regulator [Longimicrobiaceae bacterium]